MILKHTGTPMLVLDALLLLAFPLLLTLQQLVELPELTVDNHQLQDNIPNSNKKQFNPTLEITEET